MMDAKYLAEIKAAKKALKEEIRFYKHEQKDLDNRSPMDAQDSYSSGHSDAVVHIDQQIDGLNSALKLLAEVERQNQQIATLKRALILMGNDLADWMGNGTGEFWAKDYTAQAQGQEGKIG